MELSNREIHGQMVQSLSHSTCPISPGRNFTYEIIFSTEEGTLWWHAHSDWTRSSVHGAIVILPAAGTAYPFPKPNGEEVIVFGSYANHLYIYIYIYIFLFKSAYVKPFTTGYVMIAPGQTMDVLVTANQSPSQYYMLISPYYDGALYDFDESIATAVWQYNGNYTLPSAPSYPADLPHYDDVSATRTFTEGLRSLANEQYPIDVPHEIESRMFITLSMNMQSLCK
jgi:laccase